VKKTRIWPFILVGAVILIIKLTLVAIVILVLLDDDAYEDYVDYKPVDFDLPRRDYSGIDLLPGYDPNDTWAIYLYLCGSDLETEWGLATEDIYEMLEVQLPDNIIVVIEAGGALEWEYDIDPDTNSRFLYDKDGFHFIEKIPSANMGDPKALEAFLRFCNDNYPADHKVLIFWNHGGGSVAGVMYDERYDLDALSLPDIRRVLETVVPYSKEDPFYEMIAFDACFMATIDMAEVVNGFTRYMVASQEWAPGLGFDYTGFLQALVDNPGMNGAQLGKAICDTYYLACAAEEVEEDITLSVIDMSRVDALIEAYHNIGMESLFLACEDPSFFSRFGRAARKSVSYGGNNFWDGYTNMVDLGDLVWHAGSALLPNYGRALIDALDEAVVYMVNGPLHYRASGLSCYYSFNRDEEDFLGFISLNYDNPFRWLYEYKITGELSEEGIRYVLALAEEFTQQPVISTTDLSGILDTGLDDFPLILRDDGTAVLELGPVRADNLIGVYCYVAFYDDEDETIIMLGRDNDLYEDWDKGIFTDNFRGVWGSIDGVFVYMELISEADDMQLYTIPVLLNGDEFSLSVSYAYDTEEYTILGARRGIEDNGMSDRVLRQLKPGDIIEPLHYVLFDMDDDDEDFTVMGIGRITVTANTRFEEADLDDGYYIFMFEMVDVLNESFFSEAVLFLLEDGDIYLME